MKAPVLSGGPSLLDQIVLPGGLGKTSITTDPSSKEDRGCG